MCFLLDLIRRNLIGVVLMLTIITFAQIEKGNKFIVVIDPGHGGKDSGAMGINGLKEKDVVLKLALEIIKLNQKLKESELEIYLTRYSDTLISLKDRTKLAKSLKANLFISLHCNHSNNPAARGVEVYVYKKTTLYFEDSIFLAYQLQNELKKEIGFNIRGVMFSNFHVIRESIDHFPSVLLELGFLSNLDEADYLKNQNSFRSLASIIIQVILKSKGS